MKVKVRIKGTDEEVKRKSQTTTSSVINEEKKQSVEEILPSTDTSSLDYKLDKITMAMFPQSGSWKSWCFYRPKEVKRENLPCHLRDYNWLTKLFIETSKQSFHPAHLTTTEVYKYITTSPFFEQERHKYEQRIVEWQINWVLRGGGNYSLPSGMDDDDSLKRMPNCDNLFREIIMLTLSDIGMHKDAINEGLERCSDLWRREYMEIAYGVEFGCGRFEDIMTRTPPTDEEHKKNWLAIREYDYYCTHKTWVDKFGTKTPAMKMSVKEKIMLNQTLKQQTLARQKFLHEWRKNPDNQIHFMGVEG